jgi:hypothetical protein
VKSALVLLPFCLAPLLTGCHSHALVNAAASESTRAEQQVVVNTQREQLDLIPPPSKNRYMAVRNLDSWENPYITVQPGMLELHVTLADPNPSPIGAGGMLRPVGARRQELNISFDKLGEAIAAIPQSAWPYGRVVAIEEAHKTPAQAEHTVRRNMEMAVGTLNDLGIVVYDPVEGNLR